MKPTIGVCVNAESILHTQRADLAYMKIVEQAGGNPVLIAPIPDSDFRNLISDMNALILIGDDHHFGDQPIAGAKKASPSEKGDPEFDLAMQAIKDTNLPVLGICRGCLLMNQVLGGSFQKKKKRYEDDGKVKQKITLTSGSKLAEIYRNEKGTIMSVPHEEIADLGADVICSARAEDGIIEAIEQTGDRFLIGVQWHPLEDVETHLPLIQGLVAAAKRRL